VIQEYPYHHVDFTRDSYLPLLPRSSWSAFGELGIFLLNDIANVFFFFLCFFFFIILWFFFVVVDVGLRRPLVPLGGFGGQCGTIVGCGGRSPKAQI
jgi:hypothetical protein